MQIVIIGGGYVGLVLSACLAKLGHNIVCVERNQEKIADLKAGKLPIYEPGLAELIAEFNGKNIHFVTDIFAVGGVPQCYVVCVGTPPLESGVLDMEGVFDVVNQIAFISPHARVAIKSTLMPGTARQLARKYPDLKLMVWPEFLKQGSAIADFHKEHTVVGCEPEDERDIVFGGWLPIVPHVFARYEEVELMKLALNGYLAFRVSYINTIASICEYIGADITRVQKLLALDPRVGGKLFAGPGYGGSCFAKDLAALKTLPNENSSILFAAIEDANADAVNWPMRKLVDCQVHDKTVAIWGLAFKAETSDIRNSASIELLRYLARWKLAKINVYDPNAHAQWATRQVFGDRLNYCQSAEQAAFDAAGVVLMADWEVFKQQDMSKIQQAMVKPRVLLDCRNIYNPQEMVSLGFQFHGIGRPKAA